jgi:hypothetical protein
MHEFNKETVVTENVHLVCAPDMFQHLYTRVPGNLPSCTTLGVADS